MSIIRKILRLPTPPAVLILVLKAECLYSVSKMLEEVWSLVTYSNHNQLLPPVYFKSFEVFMELRLHVSACYYRQCFAQVFSGYLQVSICDTVLSSQVIKYVA